MCGEAQLKRSDAAASAIRDWADYPGCVWVTSSSLAFHQEIIYDQIALWSYMWNFGWQMKATCNSRIHLLITTTIFLKSINSNKRLLFRKKIHIKWYARVNFSHSIMHLYGGNKSYTTTTPHRKLRLTKHTLKHQPLANDLNFRPFECVRANLNQILR